MADGISETNSVPRTSAGLLLFREAVGSLEVLLVHPGGPFWINKDDGAWTIPKGEVEVGEDPLHAAVREFAEETGLHVEGTFLPLDPVQQRGKIVRAWAVRGDLDPADVRSNTVVLEWPPRSGRRQEFPEIDRAAWFPIPVAERKILTGQVPLLAQLVAMVTRR